MEPLLSLPRREFMAAIDELQLEPARRDDLVRQYRRLNSPFASIYGLLDRAAQRDTEQGTERASMLPVSRPEGMSVADAVRSGQAQFAMPQGLLDAIGGTFLGIDAPAAAYQGVIPSEDMAGEGFGAAAVSMGLGGLLTRPAGSVGMGGRVARDFDVSRRDASNIFGKGSERVRYTDPQSGGTMEVVVRPNGQASVLELEVPEEFRGQGIGQSLQARVMQDFPVMGGQVSSKAAATTAYRLGRRPYGQPDATLEDVFRMIDEDSSVNLISPAAQPTDLSANRSTTTGLLASAASDTPAQRVARLLREDRADEVTDDLMAQTDPQEMFRLYEAGETGADMPMDVASRMARAREMGFDADAFHATTADFQAFDPMRRGSATDAGWFGDADYFSPSSSYAERFVSFPAENPSVIPARLNRGNVYDWRAMETERGGMGLGNNAGAALETRARLESEGFNSVEVSNPIIKTDAPISDEMWSAMIAADPSIERYGRENISKSFQGGHPRRSLEDYFSSEMLDLLPTQKVIDEIATFSPTQVRSRFARFDPRLSHLANLNAANVDPLTGLLAIMQAQEPRQ
jgi:predicted GNAT family acetyltransferase